MKKFLKSLLYSFGVLVGAAMAYTSTLYVAKADPVITHSTATKVTWVQQSDQGMTYKIPSTYNKMSYSSGNPQIVYSVHSCTVLNLYVENLPKRDLTLNQYINRYTYPHINGKVYKQNGITWYEGIVPMFDSNIIQLITIHNGKGYIFTYGEKALTNAKYYSQDNAVIDSVRFH